MISDENELTLTKSGRGKSSQKRSAIEEAAALLFLQNGYSRTSMDAIANQASVSKQTVYSHFSSKEALFTACIVAKVSEYNLTRTDKLLDVPLLAGLVAIGRNFLTLLFDPKVLEMYRTVIGEAGHAPQIARLFFESGPAPTIAAVERFLTHHQAGGRLRVEDAHHSAVLLLDMFGSKYHLRLLLGVCSPPDEEELSQYIHKVADEFLRIVTA